MIICGFPGVGKSTLAKVSNWVDLESAPFDEAWQLYAKVAKHMSDSGYNVMVSTHPQLLNEFEHMEVKYTVVVPPLSDMSTYEKRYIKRGDRPDFVSKITRNWDTWIGDIITRSSVNKTVVVLPTNGCLQAYIKRYENV